MSERSIVPFYCGQVVKCIQFNKIEQMKTLQKQICAKNY